MKLLSINYQAMGLLGVLSSHIMIHLSALRLQPHGTEEWKRMARGITMSRIHKRWCNSHEIPVIKKVILQGRADQKLDCNLICRTQLLWPNPKYGWGTGVCFSYSFWNRMAWRTTRVIGIDERMHAYSWLSIDRRGSETTKMGQLKRTYDFLSCGCMD